MLCNDFVNDSCALIDQVGHKGDLWYLVTRIRDLFWCTFLGKECCNHDKWEQCFPLIKKLWRIGGFQIWIKIKIMSPLKFLVCSHLWSWIQQMRQILIRLVGWGHIYNIGPNIVFLHRLVENSYLIFGYLLVYFPRSYFRTKLSTGVIWWWCVFGCFYIVL